MAKTKRAPAAPPVDAPEDIAAAEDALDALFAEPAPARGARVLYTNRLGVGPWPGIIEDAHVEFAGVACCWLRVVKPNGNEFFTAAPMGDGPDTFTLAD